MRPTLPAVLALALLPLLLVPSARAGDEAEAAADRMREQWNRGVGDMSPDEVDAHRAALLEPLAASGSVEALNAVLVVARDRLDKLNFIEKTYERIDEEIEALEEAKKDAEEKGDPAPVPPPGKDRKSLEEERALYPEQKAREERWQPQLAAACAVILDDLRDRDFEKEAADRLRNSFSVREEGWDAWLALALGGSKKARTAELVIEIGAASLERYREALKRRQVPAKKLDDVNKKINEIVKDYLEREAKQGRYPDSIPRSFVERYLKDQEEYQRAVRQMTAEMDAAELERLAARAALGAQAANAPEDVRAELLDMIEKELLDDRDFMVKAFGLGALGAVPGDRALGLLKTAVDDPSPQVVVPALDALGERDEAEVIEILAARLKDPRWQVRAAAALGLGKTGRAAAVPVLIAALDAGEGRTVDDLKAALVEITGQSFPPVAAAWQRWWKDAGPGFRGPKDPKPEGGEVAKKDGDGKPAGDDAPPGDAPKDGKHRVSFYGIETNSERILFILDFSGSMNFVGSETDKKRKKIDILRDEMEKTLAGLPDGSIFNIIGFSVDVRPWKKKPVERDGKAFKDAKKWVDGQPVVGGTNIYDALEHGFRLIGVGASDRNYEPVYDTIFFMTDGKPTAGKVTRKEQILADVRRWNEASKIRIHVIGMGGKRDAQGNPHRGGQGGAKRPSDLDEDFLKELAEDNDGECVIH